MNETKTNIALIGMPGSGKSTVGVLLAKASGRDFVDTDLLIQSRAGATLQTIVDENGYEALREVEEQVLLSLQLSNHVIATGGSVVYSEPGMAHLKTSSVVVFLDVSLETVRERIGDYSLRGISKRPDQTIEDLFDPIDSSPYRLDGWDEGRDGGSGGRSDPHRTAASEPDSDDDER